MPNSLRTKIKKLAHDGKITEIECVDLLTKIDGHDAEIRKKVLNELIKKIWELQSVERPIREAIGISLVGEIAEQMKGEEE